VKVRRQSQGAVTGITLALEMHIPSYKQLHTSLLISRDTFLHVHKARSVHGSIICKGKKITKYNAVIQWTMLLSTTGTTARNVSYGVPVLSWTFGMDKPWL
jgi:hypothetical protein